MKVCWVILLLLLMSSQVTADVVERMVPEGKTASYLELLLKRPRPGYLFDRFLNSWLESADMASLEAFLDTSDDEMEPALLAFYFESVGEHGRASLRYEELVQANPEWIELLYYKATVDSVIGAYEDATTGLNELLAKEPKRELELKALKLLGRTLLRSGKEREGLAAWERLLIASEMDPDVAEELLDMQLAEGLYDEALTNCDEMLKASKDPYREVMLRMRRASILVRMDRRDDAVEGLREAFELTGEGSWLRRDVISRIELLYLGEDDLPGMCDCLDDMLKEWPGNPTLLKARAELARSSGHEGEALASARELVRLMPNARETKDWYVELLLEMRLHDEAIATIEEFVERYPADNTLRARLADVNHRAGNDGKAFEWAMEYLAYSARETSDYLDVARTLARYDLNDEATSVYLDLLAKWPDSARGREAIATHMSRESYLHLQLAWVHYEWLAKDADSETLTRLASVLMAANSPSKARSLLLSRRADFRADYRYLTALFEATSATREPEDLLEIGRERVEAAETVEEMELATAALVYEIKSSGVSAEWVAELSAKPEPSVNDFWLLVTLRLANNETAAANQLVLNALEGDPTNETLLRCRLSIAKRLRDWKSAEEVLTRLIESNPPRRAIWIRELVPVLIRAGRTEDALAWIEDWKKASPNATRPYELERDALVEASRYEEAIATMRSATRRFDDSIQLKLALGRLYENRGRTADAERLYWRLLNAEETLDGRLTRLSDLIRVNRNSNLTKLIRELEIRAENAPTSPFPLLGLAECHRVNNRSAERAEALERVLELRPNDVTVLRAKAALEEDLGDYVAARELMLRVADLEPAGGAYARIVEFEILYGDPAIAKTMMEDPRVAEDLDNFIDLAARLIAAGTSEPIADRLERLAVEHPKDYRLAFLRGCLLEEAERPSEAVRVFAPLLGVEEERPGAVSGPASSASSSNPYQMHSNVEPHRRQMVAQWRIQYGATISDELLEMYSLAMYGVNGRRVGQRYGAAPRSVEVPDTLEELESSVLLKLGELISTIPEEERVELVAVLDEREPYVGLLSIRSTSGVHSADWWDAAVERYPDDEDVRLMRVFVGSHTISAEEDYKEMIAEFSVAYPELALVTLTHASHRYPDLLSMLPAVAANTGVTDDNVELLTRSCVAWLARVPATNEAYQAAVDLFEKIEARNLENDELKADAKLILAAARAMIDDDFTGLLDLAEESFNTPSEAAAAAMGMAAQWRHNRPIHFPPYMLPSANVGAVYMGFGVDEENETLMKALMDRPADSLFRWLALSRMGADAETLAAATEAVAAKEPKTEDELYALMCWSAVSNEVEHAVGYALEARAFPEDDKDRRALRDRDLITLVSRLDEIPEERREELLAVKKELDSSVLWSERETRLFVIDFYDRVGVPLSEIERRLSYSKGTSSTSASRPASARRSTYRPPDFYQQFRTAVDQQTDLVAALTRVAVLTRSDALLAIHPSGGGQTRNHWTLRNCAQYIKERDLADRYLALFTPGDRAPSAREMFERAYALELMGREEEALEAYGEVVEARPDWSGPRSRYCVALAAKDPEKALELMNQLPSSRRAALVETYQQRFYDNNASFEDRVAMVELIVGMLESGESLDETVVQRYINALFNGARNTWSQNQRGASRNAMLPPLNHASEEGSLGADWTPTRKLLTGNMAYWKDEGSTDAQRRRREAHARALKVGASMASNLAQTYYARWTAYIDFSAAPVEESEYFTLARAVLVNAGQSHRYYDSSERGERREALEVYVEALRRRDDWSDAEALLTEMKGVDPKQDLRTLMELNAAENDGDYTNRLTAAMEADAGRNVNSPWLLLAFKYHVEDDRPGDLQKMVWARVDATAKNSSYASPARLVIALAKIADEVGVDVAELFERFLEKLFTPVEREIIAKAAPRGIDHMTSSSIYSKYHQMASAFNGVDLPPESLSRFLTVLEPYERKMNNAYISRNLTSQLANRATDVEWMKGMGFLGTVDEFPFIAFSGGQQSLARHLCDRVNGAAGKPLVAAVEEFESPTFGGDVLKALAGNTSWNERLTDLIVTLGVYHDALDAAPEKTEAVYDWIVEMESHRRATINAQTFSADAMRAHETYLAWKRSAATRRADDLEAFGVSDYARDPYGKQNLVRSVMVPLIESDPERARAMFARSYRMLKLAYLAQGNRGYDDRQMMSQMFQRPTYSEAEVRFVVAAVAEMNSVSAYQWLSVNYVQRMGSSLERRHREGGLDQRAARAAAGKETLEILLPMGAAVSAQGVWSGLSRVDSRDRAELAQWLAEREFPESAAARLATIYLDPKNADSEWLKTYFADVNQSALDRFKAYSILSGLGNEKPEILNESTVLFGLVDVVERDATAKLPRAPFKEVCQRVEAMEDAEEKEQWIERCLALWRSERVEGAPSNLDTCYPMAEFAEKAGRLEDARLILSHPQLAKVPPTYAVAMRMGLDDFVAARLPKSAIVMNNSYPSNHAWIRAEDVERCDAIMEGIEDDQERLAAAAIFARFHIETESGKKPDAERLKAVLVDADEYAENPALMAMFVNTFYTGDNAKLIERLALRYAQTINPAVALKNARSNEMNAYAKYVEQLMEEGELDVLRGIVAEVWNVIDERRLRSISETCFVKPMFAAALEKDSERGADWIKDLLEDDAWSVAFRVDAYVWLAKQGAKKPDFMSDEEFVIAMMEFAKNDPRAEGPVQSVVQGNGAAVEAYIAYFDALEKKKDWKKLEEELDAVATWATRDLYNAPSPKKGAQHLISCCLRSDDAALVKKTWATALKLERLLNANATMGVARRTMGRLSFDPSGMEWEKLEPAARLAAYEAFDKKMMSQISNELKTRWDKRITAGVTHPAARFAARVGLIDEMLEATGSDGFLPLCQSFRSWFGLHYSTPRENAALITYLHSIERDSLMLAQLKASVSLFYLERYSPFVPDRRIADVEAYLARTDLDDVEKVRFVSYGVKEGSAEPVLNSMKDHLPALLALTRNEPLIDKHLEDFLLAFPVPVHEREFASYETILKHLSKKTHFASNAPDTARAIRVLLAMDRRDEAEPLMDAYADPDQIPAIFIAALEGGDVEWCERRLAVTRALPAVERAAAYGEFDSAMNTAWPGRKRHDTWYLKYLTEDTSRAAEHELATNFELWFNPGFKGFIPIHVTLKNYVWTPELERYFDGKDASRRIVAQAIASISAHGLERNGSRSLEERTRDIERYLTRDDLDDVEILDFAAANSAVSIVGIMSPASRRAVIDALKRKPEFVERYRLAVLRVARGPIESADRALFEQCADRVMKNFDGMNAVQKRNAHTLDQMTELLPTLRALGREEDIDRILSEEKLYPARHPNLFRVALDLGKVDWCLERLEGWLAMHVRDSAVGPDVHTAQACVRALLDRVEDPDLRCAAEIFFETTVVGEKSPKDFKELAARFNEHAFSNAVWLAVSRYALEKTGTLAPAAPALLLEEWAEGEVVPALEGGMAGFAQPEEIAFEVYLLGLLNEGRIDEVTRMYQEIAKSPKDADRISWLLDIPTRDDLEICEALLRGERVALPQRYGSIDLEDRYQLQLYLERISREKSVARTPINSHVSPALFALAGDANEFTGKWNVASRRFDLLFSAYVLYSGAANEEMDEKRLRELIIQFRDQALIYKDLAPGGFFGRYDWDDARTFIPRTYPYATDAKKWKKIVDEILPSGVVKLPPRDGAQ